MDNKEQIKIFFEENFMVEFDEDFNDESSLLDNGIIDSTGILELVTYLEENYNIQINDDEVIPENLDSFSNIDSFLQSKISSN